MIKLIPIYDKGVLLNQFQHFIEGLERVIDNSIGDTSLTQMFNSLMSGRLLMWGIFCENKYSGFVITELQEVPDGKKFLWIVQGYIKPGTDKDVFFEVLTCMEEQAKKIGAGSLRLQTMRDKGFEKKLSGKGWDKGYVEFDKEVR